MTDMISRIDKLHIVEVYRLSNQLIQVLMGNKVAEMGDRITLGLLESTC